jgi:hypothetical protein
MIATEILPRSDLQTLLSHRAEWCASIYMGTHRAGTDNEQDPIRLKNLLKDAEEQLVARGVRRTKAKELLQPATDLLADAEYWQHQGDGLALFLAPGLFREFRSPMRIHELVVVGDRFEIKPLLPLLAENGHFFVLALSQKRNRLLLATKYSARELPTPHVPANLKDALLLDPERQLQFHSRTGGPPGSRRRAMFHGHGDHADDAKTYVLQYFRLVDRGLKEILREERAPLVVAAVEFEQALYREANTYPHLLPTGIPGNPDDVAAEELARAAWAVVEPAFRAARQAAAERFHAAQAAGRATGNLEAVLPAAFQGRVDTLFAARGRHVWGRFSPDTLELRRNNGNGRAPDDADLLDDAARLTLANGGTVYVVDAAEVPNGGDLAALFRY